MNEALQQAYEYAKSKGYKKSINDYAALIAAKPQYLNDAYRNASSSGFSGSLEDYEVAVGLKKKDQSIGASASERQSAQTSVASTSGVNQGQRIPSGDSGTAELSPDRYEELYKIYGDDRQYSAAAAFGQVSEEEFNAFSAMRSQNAAAAAMPVAKYRVDEAKQSIKSGKPVNKSDSAVVIAESEIAEQQKTKALAPVKEAGDLQRDVLEVLKQRGLDSVAKEDVGIVAAQLQSDFPEKTIDELVSVVESLPTAVAEPAVSAFKDPGLSAALDDVFTTLNNAAQGDETAKEQLKQYIESGEIIRYYNEVAYKTGSAQLNSLEEVVREGLKAKQYKSAQDATDSYLSSEYAEGRRFAQEHNAISEKLYNYVVLQMGSGAANFQAWTYDILGVGLLPGSVQLAGDVWRSEAARLEEKSRGLVDQQLSEAGVSAEDRTKTYTELISEGKADIAAAKAAVDITNALPQIAIDAVITMVNPGVGLAMSGTTGFIQSAGSAYGGVREDQYLTTAEKSLYAFANGAIEVGAEFLPYARFAEKAGFNYVRDAFVDKAVKEAGKDGFVKGLFKSLGGEGGEEALVSFFAQIADYTQSSTSLSREIEDLKTELQSTTDPELQGQLRRRIGSAEVELGSMKVIKTGEIVDSFVVGAGAGGSMYLAARGAGVAFSVFTAKERAVIRSEEARLLAELETATTDARRSEIKKELALLSEAHNRLALKDATLYESMTEDEVKEIVAANREIRNQRITAQAIRANTTLTKEEKDQALAEAAAVVETEINRKRAIESRYASKVAGFDNSTLDEDEIRVMKEVASVDADFAEYGEITAGQTSVELSVDNVEAVIGGIISSGRLRSNVANTVEQTTKGLRNVVAAVKSLAQSSPGVKVVMHGTAESMKAATKTDDNPAGTVSRGFWTRKDADGSVREIHLYAPLLKENTAYHEAYHEAEFSQMGGSASTALAETLAKANMDKDTKADLTSFVRRNFQAVMAAANPERKAELSKIDTNDVAAMVAADPEVADEFLTELKATIETGAVSLEARTSLAGRLKEMVSQRLFPSGVGTPKTRDVVAAINSVTGKMSKGEAVDTTAEKQLVDKQSTRRQANDKSGKAQPVAGNKLFSEPLEDATRIAERYVKDRGIEGYEKPERIRTIDKDRAKRISDEFDAMKHSPTDPEVIEAYELMAEETLAQYETIIAEGYVVEVNNTEPYSSSGDMIEDLRNNKRMKIFSTESGFGDEPITEEQRAEDPRLRRTQYTDVNGVPLLVNDVFRFVHDFFGHAKLGNSFGAIGEENAWRVHAAMFTPKARRAMTTETRGQNSWVNFSGINDEAFAIRDQARRLREEGKTEEANELVGKVYEVMKFAEQKLGLLPEWAATEGAKGKAQLPAALTPEGELRFSKGETADISEVVSDVNDQLYGPLYSWWKANGLGRIRFSGLRPSEGAALYYPATNVIAINTNRKEEFQNIDRNVAHEIIHGMLHKAEVNDPRLAERVSKIREDLIAAVESGAALEMSEAVASLYKFVVDGSHQELITYALTSPEFGKWLSSIAYQTTGKAQESIWQRIVVAILDGVRSVESSMLDAVAEVMDDYSESFELNESKSPPSKKRTDPLSIPGAPDGNFLNIGLLEEKTDRKIPVQEVLSQFPQDVEVISANEVQGTEPTVSIQLSRKLSDAEMDKLLADTKQLAIPQLSGGEGVLHGTTDWGPFDPKEFKMLDGRPLSDTTSGLDKGRLGKMQIIGENAYLSQSVRDNLAVARDMEKSGSLPRDIRMATGWERGVDNKWRYEIEPKARLNLRLSPPIIELTNGNLADVHEGALEDLVRFDELFRLYPKLKRMPVDLYIGGIDGVQGALSVAGDGTPIYIQMFAKDKATALSGMIHEIQHAVQQIEGFAIGGDPTTIVNDRRELSQEEKFETYKRLAGEAEARNAQERAKMSTEERQAKTLQETEDVAREEQIVVFQVGKAQFIDEIPLEVKDSPVSISSALETASQSSIKTNLEFKELLQERFKKHLPLIKKKYKVKSGDVMDENLFRYLVDAYVYETLLAVSAYPEALGWYDEKTKAAMGIMALIHPEIKTDKEAEAAFKISLAVTSNGNKVDKNFEEAEKQYKAFKESGRFSAVGNAGSQRAAIDSTFAFANKVLEYLTMSEFAEFLTTPMRAGDLYYIDDNGKKKALINGLGADEIVFGAAVFGPKIGNGFFMNLYGNFDQLTMDRWFMRQYGRLTGTLIDRRKDLISKNKEDLRQAVRSLDKEERRILSSVIGSVNMSDVVAVAGSIEKATARLDKRSKLSSTDRLNNVRKAGNNLSKNAKGEVEAPTGPRQRLFIVSVFDRVQEVLREEAGIDISIADLQAVNWYPEKALYQTFRPDMSIESGREETSDSEQPDYESAAKKIAKKYGVQEQQINDATSTIRRSAKSARESQRKRAVELGEASSTTAFQRSKKVIEDIAKGVEPSAEKLKGAKQDLRSNSLRKSGKAQDDLDAYVAELINRYGTTPQLRTVTVKGKTILVDAKALGYVKAGMAKPDIMRLLTEHLGLSKAEAEITYKRAKVFLSGNRAGKKEAYDFAKATMGKWLDLRSREAISLRAELMGLLDKYADLESLSKDTKQELSNIRMKAWSTNEFLLAAIELVNQRMADRGNPPFTPAQITKLFEIVQATTKVSAENVRTNGYAVVETFVNRLSKIFDAQDAKAEMDAFEKQVKTAKSLQKKLSAIAKKERKPGDSRESFRQVAADLSKIDPVFLPDVQEFIDTAAELLAAASNTKTIKDDNGDVIAVVPNAVGITAEQLQSIADRFSAVEETFRDVYRRHLAEKRANTWANEEYNKAVAQGWTPPRPKAKGETDRDVFKDGIASQITQRVSDEYDAILKAEQDKLIPATRKKLNELVEAHNAINPSDQRSLSNWQDLEYFYDILAQQRADEMGLRKEAVIEQAIGELLEQNAQTFADQSEFVSILGDAIDDSGPVPQIKKRELVNRLSKLSMKELLQLEFRMRDFVDNGNKYGLGQLEAALSAKLDGQQKIAELVKSGLMGRSSKLLSGTALFDSMESFFRLVFPGITKDKLARLRTTLGITGMVSGYALADSAHADNVRRITEKMDEIRSSDYNGRKGDVESMESRMIAQIYSMMRQHHQRDGISESESKAEWFNDIRKAAERSIADLKKQGRYTNKEIKELESAFDYLFSKPGLDDLIADVDNDFPDIVEFVDFMANLHNSPENFVMFSEYVERFLGKSLEYEPNYTPFSVIQKTGSSSINAEADLMAAAMETVLASSLNQAKKTAGASYSRNRNSLRGTQNLIGLDFLKINEETLRENTTLAHTIRPLIYAARMFNSEEIQQLIPDDAVRSELARKMVAYAGGHRKEVPAIMRTDLTINGKRIPNPLSYLRTVAAVKAFGSLVTQTLKQSTVLTSVLLNTKNKSESAMFLARMMFELGAAATKTGLWAGKDDMKIALMNDGRYDLLRRSPVFMRDYEKGQINPYNGSISARESVASQFVGKVAEFSLKNLKGTDKLAALASWFTFYGDYLITTGRVSSFSEINWMEESRNPDMDAVSYADQIVSKDQAASTPREAVDLYTGGAKGVMSTIASVLSAVVWPYSRFALNKKRSISYSAMKLVKGDAAAKKEAAFEFVGNAIEATTFAAVSYMLIPVVVDVMRSALGFDDEEEDPRKDLEFNRMKWSVIKGAILDSQPVPLFIAGEDLVTESINKAIYYSMYADDWSSQRREGDIKEGFERWKSAGNGLPVFKSKEEAGTLHWGLKMAGPQGVYISDIINTTSNLMRDGETVVTTSGKEYYIRPEDREQMKSMFLLKSLMNIAAAGGLSIKEIEYFVKKMDDQPRDRRLNSEEEYLAYIAMTEAFVEEQLMSPNDPAAIAIKEYGLEGAVNRFEAIHEHLTGVDPSKAGQMKSKFTKIRKSVIAEEELKKQFPDDYRKYIAEIRAVYDGFDKSADSRSYAYLNFAEQLPPTDKQLFLDMAGMYVYMRSEQGSENLQWYMEDIRNERQKEADAE